MQYCYKFCSKLCKPISYSYGALHNAQAHIGQFCNPQFFSTYFFQKQNSTKAADYFWYKRRNKVNHKIPKLLLKDTHATLQSGSLISTTQSSPLSHIRTWANRSILFHIQRCVTDGRSSQKRGTQWATWSHGWLLHTSEICLTPSSRLNLELLVPRTIHEGHS